MTHNERVLELLRDGQPHSHHELYALGVIAHSRVSDLRRRGYAIQQWRDGELYLYRLSEGQDSPPVSRGGNPFHPTPLPNLPFAESASVEPAGSAPAPASGGGGQIPFWMDNENWSKKA